MCSKDPHYHRNQKLKKRYGLSPDEYNNILENQLYECAICGVNQHELKVRFHVDHCHDTGYIRGLLCNNCNQGIGKFKDSLDVIKKAYEYVMRNDYGNKVLPSARCNTEVRD